MRGIAGFTQLHSQPADVAELIRRMRSPLTPRMADGETSRCRPDRDACLANPVSGVV